MTIKLDQTIFSKWYVQLTILVLTLAAYLATKNIFFGLLVAAEILFLVAAEMKQGIREHGWKNELKDTFIALLVAVAAWYLASFLLNTSSPISAVVSCSMLPNLQRGDFVIVQGAGVSAYEIAMSEKEVEALKQDSIVEYDNRIYRFKGSIYSYCVFVNDQLCGNFSREPEMFIEKKGNLSFQYSQCQIDTASGTRSTPCISGVYYEGKFYKPSKTNDIIVYTPAKSELYSLSGDIVHRSYFKIKTESGIYYLSKGDNNPVFDIQIFDYARGMGNDPITPDKLKGKVIFKVPLLGYFKLFISGFFSEPDQCKTQLRY